MTLIGERDRTEIRKILGAMGGPVKLINFTQSFECDTCHDTRELLEELTADAIEINEYPHLAQRYRVMGVPKTMINGKDGIEGGLPETAFVNAIVMQTGAGNEK